MAVTSNFLHTFRVLNQCMSNLIQLQRDMAANANTWKAMAAAQSPSAAVVASYMNSAATSYSTRLGWIGTLQANAALWTRVRTMWATLGGTASDFNGIVTPLRTVANQLPGADKSTYAAIDTVCDQIIAAIDKPDSLWPE